MITCKSTECHRENETAAWSTLQPQSKQLITRVSRYRSHCVLHRNVYRSWWMDELKLKKWELKVSHETRMHTLLFTRKGKPKMMLGRVAVDVVSHVLKWQVDSRWFSTELISFWDTIMHFRVSWVQKRSLLHISPFVKQSRLLSASSCS